MAALARPLGSTELPGDGEEEPTSTTRGGMFSGVLHQLGRTFSRGRATASEGLSNRSGSLFGALAYSSLPSTVDDDLEAGRAGGGAGQPNDTLPAAGRGKQEARMTKAESLGRLSSLDNPSQPVCLICLDQLSPEDFEAGEALQLHCACRGDLAMRHRTCAAKWAGIKGDNVCDICKQEITNLPEPILPTPPASEMGEYENQHELHPDMLPFGVHSFEAPTSVDLVFDCIRVMWVSMIVCILFFEMDMSSALWTGVVVGLGYTLFMRIMYRSHLAFAHSYQQQAAAAMGGVIGGVGNANGGGSGNVAAAAVPPPAPVPLPVIVPAAPVPAPPAPVPAVAADTEPAAAAQAAVPANANVNDEQPVRVGHEVV